MLKENESQSDKNVVKPLHPFTAMVDSMINLDTMGSQLGSYAKCPNLGSTRAHAEDARIIYACASDGEPVFAKKVGNRGQMTNIYTGNKTNQGKEVGTEVILDCYKNKPESWRHELQPSEHGLFCEALPRYHLCGLDKNENKVGPLAQYALVKKAGVTWDDLNDDNYEACVSEQWAA